MRLSVLDYGLLDEGKIVQEALQETVQLAKRAEELGFHRFWVAEHHNVHALTISNPELVMMHLLNQTQTIRIGSGGIMALHQRSYRTAEIIKTLTSFFPDRVDIGLGNSLGTPLVNQALKSVYTSQDYGQVLAEIKTYLSQQEGDILVQPNGASLPPIWLLGMSDKSAQLAGQLGLGYTYGIFPFVPLDTVAKGQTVAETYRQTFVPSEIQSKPHLILAIFVALADEEEEAEDLAKSLDVWFLGKQDFNDFEAFPSLDTALNYELTEADRDQLALQRQRFLVGAKEQVKGQLAPLLATIQPDELLVIPLVAGIDKRIKTLELLSELSF